MCECSSSQELLVNRQQLAAAHSAAAGAELFGSGAAAVSQAAADAAARAGGWKAFSNVQRAGGPTDSAEAWRLGGFDFRRLERNGRHAFAGFLRTDGAAACVAITSDGGGSSSSSSSSDRGSSSSSRGSAGPGGGEARTGQDGPGRAPGDNPVRGVVAAGQALAQYTLAALSAMRIVAVDPGCVLYLVACVGYLRYFSPHAYKGPTRAAQLWAGPRNVPEAERQHLAQGPTQTLRERRRQRAKRRRRNRRLRGMGRNGKWRKRQRGQRGCGRRGCARGQATRVARPARAEAAARGDQAAPGTARVLCAAVWCGLPQAHGPDRAPAVAAGTSEGTSGAPALAGRDPQCAGSNRIRAHTTHRVPLRRWQCCISSSSGCSEPGGNGSSSSSSSSRGSGSGASSSSRSGSPEPGGGSKRARTVAPPAALSPMGPEAVALDCARPDPKGKQDALIAMYCTHPPTVAFLPSAA